jgi:subtilisin family serine protease
MPFFPKQDPIPDRYLVLWPREVPAEKIGDLRFLLPKRVVPGKAVVLDVKGVEIEQKLLKKAMDTPLIVEQDQRARPASVASWGLDRIDQPSLPLNDKYDPIGDGKGVDVYVLDTGVRSEKEFENRLKEDKGFSTVYGSPTDDPEGHGTAVAAIIGGKYYGVARAVNLIPAQVWNEERGSAGTILCGVQETAKRAQKTTVVACLAVYTGFSQVLNQAVRDAAGQGVIFVVAAGNDGDSASLYSPGSEGYDEEVAILTAGATLISDSMWDRSNYGESVTLLAPGVEVSTLDVRDFFGTSAAAAHVAGAAAIYLGLQREGHLPSEALDIKKLILQKATPNKIAGTDYCPNLLLYVGKPAEGLPNGPHGNGGRLSRRKAPAPVSAKRAPLQHKTPAKSARKPR